MTSVFRAVFIYLAVVGRNDAGGSTHASTQVVFISHAGK